MQSFLAQCSGMMAADMPVFVSLFLAGMMGSASHCSVMCSPLVAAQMLSLQGTSGRQHMVWFYHVGRLSTYGTIGMAAQQMGQFIFSASMVQLSHWMMVAAGVVFVISALKPAKTHKCCTPAQHRRWQRMESMLPPALAHVLRGAMMGFMPCGMVVAALMLAATMQEAWMAFMGMVVFGMATVPALQAAGILALRIGKSHPRASALAGRGVMMINGLILCAIGMWMPGLN